MKDATHIAVLLDRSGSMEAVKDETISGFNYFLKEQKAAGDNASFTLVQFDSQSTDVVHEARPVRDVPNLNGDTYQPRGSTPLLDALGETINSTGRTLAAIPDPNRPDKVVFVVITDGEENASHKFTKSQVKEMIGHQTEKYNWQFIYLGANQETAEQDMRRVSSILTSNAQIWYSLKWTRTKKRNTSHQYKQRGLVSETAGPFFFLLSVY